LLYALDHALWFPPLEEALPDGLLAIGGDVSKERLLLAYQKGIFPWYEGKTPMWWCPNPRFVLFPQKLKVSKSMLQIIKKGLFEYRFNTNFNQVIHHCKQTPRVDQDGTWITDELEQAFIQLHQLGIACSAEAWLNNRLVGGLYGLHMNNIFYGESMFSTVSNASKFAFIHLVEQLSNQGCTLIDCQVYTPHLESLGAEMMDRTDFLTLISA
jgi:leucyl/phenylalanyl-tRNA--protein transferase